MKTARCKFAVTGVTDHGHEAKTVQANTQYDQTIPEDRSFTKYTPSGEFKALIQNPAVLEWLKPGVQIYVDITLIEPEG